MKKVGVKLASMMMLVLLVGCSAEKNDTASESTGSAQVEYTTANTDQVLKALGNEDWVVVDTRLNDAFNGWKLDGVSRGGHIKGAVDFSANWLKVKADDSAKVLTEALQTKGISKGKSIVLYDVNGEDAKQVAAYLQGKGFEHLYIYDLNQWANDSSLPLEKIQKLSIDCSCYGC